MAPQTPWNLELLLLQQGPIRSLASAKPPVKKPSADVDAMTPELLTWKINRRVDRGKINLSEHLVVSQTTIEEIPEEIE